MTLVFPVRISIPAKTDVHHSLNNLQFNIYYVLPPHFSSSVVRVELDLKIMILSTFLLLLTTSSSLASRLFVASYSGTVSTLSLHEGHAGSDSLSLIATSTFCTPNSSWLTLDRQRDILYCSGRGLTSLNGSLNSLKVQPDGRLVPLDRVLTPIGAVSSVLYADGSALAVAY